MELCKGQNLKQHLAALGTLSEEETKQIFHQICLGLHFLHSNSICHRDIKLENILFFDKSKKLVKIIDFGFSKQAGQEKMDTFLGSPHYIAPEILSGGGYDFRCDLWSLGVCLFKMLTGNYPFEGPEMKALLENIREKPLEFQGELGQEAKDLLSCLLQKDPRKRLLIKEVLLHPFFGSLSGSKGTKKKPCKIQFKQGDSLALKRVKMILLRLMITFYHPIDEFEQEIALFHHIDASKNGIIGLDEMRKYFGDLGEQEFQQLKDIILIFQKGVTISYFIALVKDHRFWFKTEHEKSFIYNLFDNESKGHFDLVDFRERFVKMSLSLPEEILTSLFEELKTEDSQSDMIFKLDFYSFLFTNFN